MKSKQNRDYDPTLKAYLNEIRRYKLLNAEEERELAKRIEAKDMNAKSAMINANLRLVVKIARSFIQSDVNFLDLIQEGNLGLIRAVEKYDYRKNIRFSTYASWWIMQSIKRASRDGPNIIHLPQKKRDDLKRLMEETERFTLEFQYPPSLEDLAAYTGLKQEKISSLLKLKNIILSLDSEIAPNNYTLLEVLEDDSFEPSDEFERKTFRENTAVFLNSLKEQERTILMRRFAFYGGERDTLAQLGTEMGISPETVRQIELNALKKLRVKYKPMKEYLFN